MVNAARYGMVVCVSAMLLIAGGCSNERDRSQTRKAGTSTSPTVIGVTDSPENKVYLPPGSPTTSVEAAIWYNKGVKHRESDKTKAIEEFSKAIEIDGSFDNAIYNRALTYAEVDRASEAMADLK